MTSWMVMHMCSSREGVCGNNVVQFQFCDGSSYCTALGENGCTDIVSCQLCVEALLMLHFDYCDVLKTKLAVLAQMVACLSVVQPAGV